MREEANETFETWAIVELFGHSKIAGLVSEQNLAGGMFLRVDVPELRGWPAFTRFYGSGAVYSITPCTEEIARQAGEMLRVRPINVYGIAAPSLEVGEPVVLAHLDTGENQDGEDQTPGHIRVEDIPF